MNFDEAINRKNTSSLKWDKYKEKDILPLWVADMDFRASNEIVKVLHDRIDHGVMGYTNVPDELVQIVQDRLQNLYNWKTEPEWQVWMPGMVCGLNVACRAIGDEGDDVITGTPVYPPFLSAPGNFNRRLNRVPLVNDDGHWRYDLELFKKKMTEKTGLFLLCNPHNPVGRVFTKSEMTDLTDICLANDTVICSDEIHCELVLSEDVTHVPTAKISEAVEDKTITLMAPSKTFNIPGFGCTFAIIKNAELRNKFKRAMAGIVPDPAFLGYDATIAAFRDSQQWHSDLLAYLRGNRDYLVDEIEKIKGITMTKLEATYLAWLDVRELNLDNPCAHFESHGVGLSDCKPFGIEGFVRLNFGCTREMLTEALERIKKAVK
jgi:cysteine-S-conjugate beta-lyase